MAAGLEIGGTAVTAVDFGLTTWNVLNSTSMADVDKLAAITMEAVSVAVGIGVGGLAATLLATSPVGWALAGVIAASVLYDMASGAVKDAVKDEFDWDY